MVALLTPTAVYFWNESRAALADISSNRADVVGIRFEIQKLRDKVDTNSQISESQRADLKADVSRVESKVDRLDERLSRWFERASRTRE